MSNLPDPKIPAKGDILVVDDNPDNLRLLTTLLSERNYQVRSAISGPIALAAAQAATPDLILLDVDMPRMDGYEVCQRLKADSRTQDVPVIFISALGQVMDKVKAFGMGAADYITKPFQFPEVLARIEHQLTLRLLQQELVARNSQLIKEIKDRQQAEDSLRKTEAKYRSIFENAIAGIFQASPDGHYISVNPALARIFGYDSPEDLIQSVSDISKQVYVQPHRRAELSAYLQMYGAISDSESQVYRKDGTIIWISENIRLIKGEGDVPTYYEGSVQEITDRRRAEEELRIERKKTERLLLNILPQPIAEQLKDKRQTIADQFEEATILFADLVDFTPMAARLPPTEMLDQLNQIFSTFDQMADQLGLEKIKTIGDAYMVVGGLPTPRSDHAEAIADMALSMQQAISQFHRRDNGTPFRLRIGIDTGPVVAGVIGIKKFSYDLWGDTVNVASRMESQGVPNCIQITEATHKKLEDHYICERRGEIIVKGKGKMTTYWLIGKKYD